MEINRTMNKLMRMLIKKNRSKVNRIYKIKNLMNIKSMKIMSKYQMMSKKMLNLKIKDQIFLQRI